MAELFGENEQLAVRNFQILARSRGRRRIAIDHLWFARPRPLDLESECNSAARSAEWRRNGRRSSARLRPDRPVHFVRDKQTVALMKILAAMYPAISNSSTGFVARTLFLVRQKLKP